MTKGVRIRLAAFAVLAAVGIVYIAGTYLGLVDRVLGRGLQIHATLPASGGLYEGSEVTYRGVKVGKVTAMHVIPEGLRADLSLEHGTKIPLDAEVFVHNLSAVGEQYLDLEPADDKGPYAENGDTLAGSARSLPVAEEDLLIELDELVGSVNTQHLNTVLRELGTAFRDTADPLQRMLDGGDQFLEAAIENEDATFSLLENGQTVLATQQRNRENIRSFARDLADLTGTLKQRDPELRKVLEGGGSAVREVDALMQGLEPTMPIFISNLVTLNQVVTARLPALEQLLVTFPKMVAAGFTGTPGDGYGHINLQFAQSPGPCREGYMPSSQWRDSTQLEDTDPYPARCLQGAPYNMRGSKYAPRFDDGTASRVAPYDPATGIVQGDAGADDVMIGHQGGLQTVFGDDSWRWMLIGPMEPQ